MKFKFNERPTRLGVRISIYILILFIWFLLYDWTFNISPALIWWILLNNTKKGSVLGACVHHSNLSRCKNTASTRRTVYGAIELPAILYDLYASGICDLWHCFGFTYHNKRDMHFYYRNHCIENQRSGCTIHIQSGFETVSEKTNIKYQ